jgi:integrase
MTAAINGHHLGPSDSVLPVACKYRRTITACDGSFTLLLLGGLRIAELSGNSMSQFLVRCYVDGTMRWWLTGHGKGDKERLVPALRELMTELSR